MHHVTGIERSMRIALNPTCLVLPADLECTWRVERQGHEVRCLQGLIPLYCTCRGFQLGVWRISAVGLGRKRLAGPSAAAHRSAIMCHIDSKGAFFSGSLCAHTVDTPDPQGRAAPGPMIALAKVPQTQLGSSTAVSSSSAAFGHSLMGSPCSSPEANVRQPSNCSVLGAC